MKSATPLQKLYNQRRRRRERNRPRGVIVVITGFCLCAIFAFVALSVDAGRMVLTETKMQNAVDAAALAAAQEIQAAVYAAGQGQGSADIDANSIAIESARNMAAQVAAANGVYIDPVADVRFGKRTFGADNSWPIQWNSSPYNVVQVTARKTNSDTTAPDGELPLAFGWAVGRSQVPLQTSATAFVEARDLVVVLDVSASMNDDSTLNRSSLSQSQVEGSLDAMWNALRTADPKWPNTVVSKFPDTGFGRVNSAAGTYYSSTDTNTIFEYLQLDERNSDGSAKYPFPQSGRYSSGSPKPKPNNYTSDNLWKGYINYVKNLSGSYKKRYGYRTLLSYLQDNRHDPGDSEDLWRTPHYPFHANRNGMTLFLDFLTELDFGDEVGWVAYGEWAVQQKTHNDGEVTIDITGDPITNDYATIDVMHRRHQAGEYNGWTAMGDGILKARELLLGADGNPSDDGYSRYGARPTMLIMTDGQTNQRPDNWSLPSNFSWAKWTDYDGDGSPNYTTTDKNKQYAFYEATKSIEFGCTLHTLAVGAGADRDLMKAIAYASGGIYIDVPGGSTVAEMEEQLLDAFRRIASKVPPAKLVYEN